MFACSICVCTFKRLGLIKMTLEQIDCRYYINVARIMQQQYILPRPRLKRTVIVNDGEWLQLIGVTTEV